MTVGNPFSTDVLGMSGFVAKPAFSFVLWEWANAFGMFVDWSGHRLVGSMADG